MAAYLEISAVKCSYVAEHIVPMFISNSPSSWDVTMYGMKDEKFITVI